MSNIVPIETGRRYRSRRLATNILGRLHRAEDFIKSQIIDLIAALQYSEKALDILRTAMHFSVENDALCQLCLEASQLNNVEVMTRRLEFILAQRESLRKRRADLHRGPA